MPISGYPVQRVVLTYADLQTMPEDGRRYEILEGELCVTPSPSTQHQRVSGNLTFVLQSHVTQHDLGELFYAPLDVILDRHTVVEPDILFVAKDRLGIIRERAIEGAPDLIVEIASPSTEDRDRGPKRQAYERYGVAHYWCVDPYALTLTELVLEQGSYRLRGTFRSPATFRSALFPELAIDLSSVLQVPAQSAL